MDSRGGEHPLSEQILNEQRGVALRAQAARTHRTSKHVAIAASTLAEEALAAPAALVDRVSHQHFSALKCSAHRGQIKSVVGD